MSEILAKAPHYIELASQYIGMLALLATFIVQLTPSPKDDVKMGKIVGILLKLFGALPTLGVNPETKRLKKAYEELKAQK